MASKTFRDHDPLVWERKIRKASAVGSSTTPELAVPESTLQSGGDAVADDVDSNRDISKSPSFNASSVYQPEWKPVLEVFASSLSTEETETPRKKHLHRLRQLEDALALVPQPYSLRPCTPPLTGSGFTSIWNAVSGLKIKPITLRSPSHEQVFA